MFKKVLTNKNSLNKLIKYLHNKNTNINWNEFIEKVYDKDDETILKRIKSLLWVDKSEDFDTDNKTRKYVDYYTKLINKFDYSNKKITIILPLENSTYSNYLKTKLNNKISILLQVLQTYSINFTTTTDINTAIKSELIIPTGTITNSQTSSYNPWFKSNITKIIPDDSFSILTQPNDDNLYNFIHLIKNYINDEDSTIYTYNYISLL